MSADVRGLAFKENS